MKENTPKFNKNLLFVIGLVVIVLVIGLFLQNRNKTNKRTAETPQATSTENIGNIDESQLNQVKPVRDIDNQDHLWGNQNAPVKMIVYDDFECPYCANYYDTLEQVKKDFGDKVVIAFRHFPLSSIHPYSMAAAEASECADEQGKFWEMYHRLFADNKSKKFDTDQFKQDAADLKLDTGKFNQCLDGEKYKDKINQQAEEAEAFNVTGTPTTFINGQIIIGANPYEDLKASDGRTIEGLKTIINRELNK